MTPAYLAVETASGPHVTPVAFSLSQCSVWFVAARRSVKGRALQRNLAVGVLVPRGLDGARTMVVSGRAELNAIAPDLPWAATAYAARNGSFLAGYAVDVVSRRAGLPLDRMPIRVPFADSLVLTDDDLAGDAVVLDLRQPDGNSPATVRELLAEDGPAVLGIETRRGPVAIPAMWDGDTGQAHVSAAALAALPVDVLTRACLTIDRPGRRPSAVSGVMLRGEATLRGSDGCLAVTRTTWWRGFESATSRAA